MSSAKIVRENGQLKTPPPKSRIVLSGTVGHALEWFDFGVYAYLSTYIAINFFPSEDSTTSLLATLATFGVGFVARPVGGLVFGKIGDRLGRRTVLLATIMLMAVATLGIALTPTYHQIGIWAPVILVICRLVQGFSAGGEATTAAVFLVEWAPSNRRGLFGSFMQVGSVLGLMMGSLVVALCTAILGQDVLADWGWRLPFAIGAATFPIAYLIRRNTDETPTYTNASEEGAKQETEQAWDVRGMVRAFLLLLFWSVGFYFFLTYMPTYLEREYGISASQALSINIVAMIVHIGAVLAAAVLSDRIGRRPVLLIGCVAFIVVPVPLFTILAAGVPLPVLYLAITLIGILLAFYTGPAATAGAEFFKTSTRSSGYAIGYNISAVIFGGFTPYIATWLIEVTGSDLAPIYYLSASALIGGIFVFTIKETSGKDLNE
ncbi:MFS transporter [Brevibacterium zhoupengii]|uniref:MFS transporter n=1 Tax=Brevibacterium zhoupengii TaxID=2898795 RepID=UPI001F09D542|nr:MFS transporter [Brevibacterium zhoupengii]